MLKSPLDNGNIKSESPRVSNVEITCGCLDTYWEESEKNSDVLLNMNQNQSLMETGMDQDAIPISPQIPQELQEVYNTLLINVCQN